jgi:hypothetical protein
VLSLLWIVAVVRLVVAVKLLCRRTQSADLGGSNYLVSEVCDRQPSGLWRDLTHSALGVQELPGVRLLGAVPHPNIPRRHPHHLCQRHPRIGPVPHQRL